MNLRRWIATVIACLLVFAALAGYKALQIREAIAMGKAYPEPSETVEAINITVSRVSEQINTIGEVIAPQNIELRNELEGRIVDINFGAGDQVNEGQLLLKLDTSEEEARLKAAKARAELARLNLKRTKKLLAKNTVSEEQLDQAQAQFDVTLADINALQSTIDKKVLRAPFTARTGIHQLEAGEFIEANTLITLLVGINNHAWVDFQLPVSQAAADIGDPVQISLPFQNREAEKPLTGKIIAKDPALSVNSRKLGYRAEIPDTGQLPPNSIVNVTLNNTETRALPLIPLTAYQNDQMGGFVYLLTPAEQENGYRARRQSVTAGSRFGNEISITHGLSGGELIATLGAFKLRENLLVYIEQPSARQSAPDTEQGY